MTAVAPEHAAGPIQAYAKLQGENFVYYVQTLEITLGRRAEANEVDVDLGPSRSISRRHARIKYDFDTRQFLLYPLGKNGVLINGSLYPAGSAVPLDTKTAIQIGDVCFYFLLPIGEVSRAVRPADKAPTLHLSSHVAAAAGQPLDPTTRPNSSMPTRIQSRHGSRGNSPEPRGDFADVDIGEAFAEQLTAKLESVADNSMNQLAQLGGNAGSSGQLPDMFLSEATPLFEVVSRGSVSDIASAAAGEPPTKISKAINLGSASPPKVQGQVGATDAAITVASATSKTGRLKRASSSGSSSAKGVPASPVPATAAAKPPPDLEIPSHDEPWHLDPAVKPPYSYSTLIAQAIWSTPAAKMTLAGIYTYIKTTYRYYDMEDPSGWMNSIRHNLSLNKAFIRIARGANEPGKGAFWGIEPGHTDKLKLSLFRKRSRGPKNATGKVQKPKPKLQ